MVGEYCLDLTECPIFPQWKYVYIRSFRYVNINETVSRDACIVVVAISRRIIEGIGGICDALAGRYGHIYGWNPSMRTAFLLQTDILREQIVFFFG